MKKILSLLVVTLMVLSLFVGCSTNQKSATPTPAETSKEKTKTIGLVISTLNNPFFVDLEAGAKAKADELGATLVTLDSQDDPAKEMSNVEDLINQKVDLIMINPTDSDAVGNAVKAANTAKIPVITLDRSASNGEVVSHIASDNVAGGKLAGEYMIELLGGKGNVVELEGTPGASAARDRGTGFNEAIAKSNIKVVTKQTANFDRAEGLTVMENILQSQPEIDAVFAHNDEMALGAVEAVKSSKRNIIVIGFDATEDAKAAVNSGDMAATVEQLPKEIGSIGVETALKSLSGEQVEKTIPVKLQLVKK
ncbi:MAG: rbsB [Bacillota bacterium]|jgi:ribose transport system substrate-binding protein|nr:rbsB [Bacillota bacterium]